MLKIKDIVLQIVEILEFFEKEGYVVVIVHKYFSDRGHSILTLGAELSKLDQSITNMLAAGIRSKTPTEALQHAKKVLEVITSAEGSP